MPSVIQFQSNTDVRYAKQEFKKWYIFLVLED
jgi:hypothetical protein